MQTLNAVVSTFISLAKLPKCRPVNHTWSVWNRLYSFPQKKWTSREFEWNKWEQVQCYGSPTQTGIGNKRFLDLEMLHNNVLMEWSQCSMLIPFGLYVYHIYIQHNVIVHESIDNTSCNINICTIWYLMAMKSMNLVVQKNTSWVGSQTRKNNSVELWSLEGDGDAQPDFFKRIG